MYDLIVLVGRVSNEVKLKYLPEKGTPVCEFDLAVSRKKSNKTNFYTIQVWGKYAEIVSNDLEVGKLILVEGNGTFDKYKDENNKTHKLFKVVTDKIKYLNYGKNKDYFNGEINEYDVRGDENFE